MWRPLLADIVTPRERMVKRLRQLLRLLSPDRLLAGGGKARIQLLFQGRQTAVRIVHGLIAP